MLPFDKGEKPVTVPAPGAIDCDVHPALPGTAALVPYLDPYWREMVTLRGLDRDNLETPNYPAGSPLAARPDWRPARGLPGSDPDLLRAQALDAFGTRFAICNLLHGAPILFSEDLSAALCRAINDWLAAEWLDRDPRLRASIVVPLHSPELAAAEIERRAADPRFVQVLLWAMAEVPLGRRVNWPVYRAAATPRPAGRDPRRQQLPPPAHLARLAVLLPGRLRRARAGLRRRAQLVGDGRGVRRVPRPHRGAAGIGRDMAARLDVAGRQDLAGDARGSAVEHHPAVRAGARRMCA